MLRAGAIKIDGQDIAKLRQDWLKKEHSAYVPQDPILFHRSLKENIIYGNPEASDEDIGRKGLRKLTLMGLFHLFRKATALWLGKEGWNCLAEEGRGLLFAGAMPKKAPILILDEATSSLDTISEKYIQDSFEQLMKGRTTIVIADRLALCKNGQDDRVRKRQNNWKWGRQRPFRQRWCLQQLVESSS